MGNPADQRTTAIRALLPVLALYAALSLGYALITPPLEAPDARAHLAYAALLQNLHRMPTPAEAAAVSHEPVQQPPLYYALVALAAPPGALQAAMDATVDNPLLHTGHSHRSTVYAPQPVPGSTAGFVTARAVAWLGGLLCVAMTALWLRRLVPAEPLAPWLAAAILACNPTFLAQSTGISNDASVAGLGALAVWLAAGARLAPAALSRWLLAGAATGLAVWTKYSGIVAALPVAVLWVAACLRSRRVLWQPALALATGFLLLAGPLALLNLSLYGEPVPLRALPVWIPYLLRPEPLSMGEAFSRLPWVWRSAWGVLNYGLVLPDWHGWIPSLLALGALAGLLRAAFINRRASIRPSSGTWLAALASLVWVLGAAISLLVWMRTMLYSDQGRLLYPAASGLAAFLGLGWGALLRSARLRIHHAATCVVGAALLVMALWPLSTLSEAYRVPPPAAAAPSRPVEHRFANGARLVGIDFSHGAHVSPGAPMPVRLYLTADRPITSFDVLVLQLVDQNDGILYYFDGLLHNGWSPPQWHPGVVFSGEIIVTVEETVTDGLARLVAGFGSTGQASGETITLAAVRVSREYPWAAPVEPLHAWEQGIALTRAEAQVDAGRVSVDLEWRATQTVHPDYTVALEVLDAHGRVLARRDAPPQDGQYPTSTWVAGTLVSETLVIEGVPDMWDHVIVLLYDPQGRPLATVNGDDHAVILRRP